MLPVWDVHCCFIVPLPDRQATDIAVGVLLDLGTCFIVNGENGNIHTTQRGAQALLNDPALFYDPSYGDDRLCECDHPYYRHFDTYEGMAPVGCKYCECPNGFIERTS